MTYRVFYRLKMKDGTWDQWVEKAPDIQAWYANGHYRTLSKSEAQELQTYTCFRLDRIAGTGQYETEIREAQDV